VLPNWFCWKLDTWAWSVPCLSPFNASVSCIHACCRASNPQLQWLNNNHPCTCLQQADWMSCSVNVNGSQWLFRNHDCCKFCIGQSCESWIYIPKCLNITMVVSRGKCRLWLPPVESKTKIHQPNTDINHAETAVGIEGIEVASQRNCGLLRVESEWNWQYSENQSVSAGSASVLQADVFVCNLGSFELLSPTSHDRRSLLTKHLWRMMQSFPNKKRTNYTGLLHATCYISPDI
jgi:hypothetical protein